MMSVLIITSLQQGILYSIMAMGVYITFRILNIPDLTVDGSFTFGMATATVFTIAGQPFLGILLALLAGMLAGIVTGILQTQLKIHPILASILTMTSLYTVNLAVMGGKSNLSLLGKETVFTKFMELFSLQKSRSQTIVSIFICVLVIFVICVFFKTRTGLAIRATGDNEDMVRSSSINANRYKCLGLAIGNGLAAMSGALIAHYQSSADVNFGSGIVVTGLAAVIIGETFFGKHSVTIGMISAVVGMISYRIIIAFALKIDLFPSYALKLVASCIVTIALAVPAVKEVIKQNKQRRMALKDVE